MPWVGRLYTPTTVRYRLSAMARLRTIIRTVGSFLVSAGIDDRRDLVGLPKGSARAVKCLRTLFEIVDRKKEKRGRRSPCGLPSRGSNLSRRKLAQFVHGWRSNDFGGPTFRFTKPCDYASDRRAWDSSNVVTKAGLNLKLESLILAQSERWRQA